MVVCGGVVCVWQEDGEMPAWVQQHEYAGDEPQESCQAYGRQIYHQIKGIYYAQSQLVTCQVESWGRKQAAQHRGDNS